MFQELNISQLDALISLSNAVDLISPVVANHHKRVAYIASSLAAELGRPVREQNDLVVAGALHDVGALSLSDRLEILNFDVEPTNKHSEIGYRLLRSFELMSEIALLVRHHHLSWNGGVGSEVNGEAVPLGSHILHLADRVAVLVNQRQEILQQSAPISEKIQEQSGKRFMPEVVEAFRNLAGKEYFWLDTLSQSIDSDWHGVSSLARAELDLWGLLDLAKLYCKIIDLRSSFTATHSSGVAHGAEALARLFGFGEKRCQMMKIAGYLHDLGKLRVPVEIIEKPGRLTDGEFAVVRSHTYFTYRVLEKIKGLEDINQYASFHHERLNGTGYPFHIGSDDLLLGSRIMAVADVFTAMTEDRPYREGLKEGEVKRALEKSVKDSMMDGNVVSVLIRNFDEIDSIRRSAQAAALREYQEIQS